MYDSCQKTKASIGMSEHIFPKNLYIYIYIYVCVYVCVCFIATTIIIKFNFFFAIQLQCFSKKKLQCFEVLAKLFA